MDEIGEKRPETFITPDTSIGALVYVDDIAMAGSVSTSGNRGNLREKEEVQRGQDKHSANWKGEEQGRSNH